MIELSQKTIEELDADLDELFAEYSSIIQEIIANGNPSLASDLLNNYRKTVMITHTVGMRRVLELKKK